MSTELTLAVPENLTPERLDRIQREVATLLDGLMVALSVKELTPEFKARRDALLDRSQAVAQVQSAEEESAANTVFVELGQLEKEMEASKSALKGPLDALGKKILRIKEEGMESALKARARLKSMCDGYAMEKIQAQRKIAEAQTAETARLEKERLKKLADAQQLALDEEAARQRAKQANLDAQAALEAAELANSPEAKAVAERAQQDALVLQQEAKNLQEQQEQAAFDASMAEIAPVPAAPPTVIFSKGVSAKTQRDFNLIGDPDAYRMARSAEHFAAFAFANPTLNLVRFLSIEIKRRDFVDALKDDEFLKGIELPGVKVFETIRSVHR